MRVDLPAGMPVVLLHSIHDAAVAQSLVYSVDSMLSTPLCEEKLLGRFVCCCYPNGKRNIGSGGVGRVCSHQPSPLFFIYLLIYLFYSSKTRSLVAAVPVLADAVQYSRTVELVSLSNPVTTSLDVSISSFRLGKVPYRRRRDEFTW